ncbi:MAG: hypothetical protein ACI89L_002575 [Phycisphaerales bacterium]|jgi:hypothetical protein
MLKYLTASALATSIVVASPIPADRAPETFDENIPVALVSQKALEHHALARTLFQALPANQQATLTRAGAIGPDAQLPIGAGVLTNRVVEAGSLTIEKVETQFGLTFSPEHRNLLTRFQTMADAGEAVPSLCLSPDTDPKLAEALLLMIDSITGAGPERYQIGSRWSSTATDGSTGSTGDPINLTWSYVPDGTPADGDTSDLFAWLDSVYAADGGRAEWQLRISQTFTRWGFLSGINYIYEPNDDGAPVSSSRPGIVGVRGDVRICGIFIDGNSNVLAYNYYPSHGDMFLDSADNFYNELSQNSRRIKNVVSHEHGHGMGLAHVEPVSQTKLMEPFVSTAYLGPKTDDTLGAQRNYGDVFEDNNTAGTATDLGTFNDGDSYVRKDLSTDDNSDVDYFKINVSAAGDLTVNCVLAGGEYLMGPQGGSSVLTDYDSIHDLEIQIRDGADTLVQTIDNTGLGFDEGGTASLSAAGTYYIRVAPLNSTNNIQLYDFDFNFTATAIPCPVDLSGDGVVDNGDIGFFVTLFLAGDPSVDFSGDGVIDNGDIGLFVTLFLAGCP